MRDIIYKEMEKGKAFQSVIKEYMSMYSELEERKALSITGYEVHHLKWIYSRMVAIHKENPDMDYMREFKEILEMLEKGLE